MSYQSPNSNIAKLVFNPSLVKFTNFVLGLKVEEKVTVTAQNENFIVSNISSNNAAFDIIPKSFSLNSGESIELTVSYLPADSGYAFARFTIDNNLCPTEYYSTGGISGMKPKIKTIKLLQPNGGEIFVVSSDTVIKWEGILESDTVQLDYTTDNGTNWIPISDNAYGLNYKWTNIPLPTSNQCKVRIKQKINQDDKENTDLQLHKLNGHNKSVNSVSWNFDDSFLATASSDKTAIIWNTNTGELLRKLIGHADEVLSLDWSSGKNFIATASSDKSARIWDAESGNLLKLLSGHTGSINSVSWSPDNLRLATASSDKTVRIWDTESGVSLRTLSGHIGIVNSVRWSPDGSHIVTASDDKTAIIWEPASGVSQKMLNGHSGIVNTATWSPDGSFIATASDDKTCKIWELSSGSLLYTLSGHTSNVNSISWSADGSRIATASDDKTVKIWDLTSGVNLLTLSGHTDNVSVVSWSPDGTLIATTSWDLSTKMWDAETGDMLHTLNGHTDNVWALSWSSDGSRLATASKDGTAVIWDSDGKYSGLQNDESDNLFSIVKPVPYALDIDMGLCLVASSKDTVINPFISNTGIYKVRIDSIYFQGADADAFILVSGFPKYIIKENQKHAAEFRFKPNRVGVHNAEIVIITQFDTLKYTISGEGVQPNLLLLTDLIDFGEEFIPYFKDTIQVATIKNIGNAPLTITKTVHGYPNDIDFTTISGGGSFTLQPDEIHKMDLRFTPSSIGRTSGTLEFHYNGVGSPAVIQLFGQGILLDSSKFVLKTIEIEGYPGDEIIAPIIMQFHKNQIQSGITSIKVDLEFNPTLLFPLDYNFITIDDKTAKISIENLPVDKLDGEVLINIPFKVGLGNSENCKLTLSNPKTNGNNAEVQVINGTFTLLGLCEEGGKRLVNPYSKAGIVSISPNPAENQINLMLSLSEIGNTEVCLYNILGEKVSTIYSENVTQKQILPINSDLSKIASGQYILIFRTPTYTETRQLLIMR